MESVTTMANSPESATPIPEAIETEEFKLELLDCGPAYKLSDAGTVCMSCVCGTACMCGCVNL